MNTVVENKTSILEEFVPKVMRICLREFGGMPNDGKHILSNNLHVSFIFYFTI
jgi:hypothetical protein